MTGQETSEREGPRFNFSEVIGPTTFEGLRSADYGEGFRMPTMGEALHYVKLFDKHYGIVIHDSLKNGLVGNTGVLYGSNGIFVQDNPELRDGRICMDVNQLESRLGSYEEKEVVFSDDKSVRFAHYGYKISYLDTQDIKINPAIIALLGGSDNAETLSETYLTGTFLCHNLIIPSKLNRTGLVRVPGFVVKPGKELKIVGDIVGHGEENFDFMYTHGISETGETQ